MITVGAIRDTSSFLGGPRTTVGAKGSISERLGGHSDSCSVKTGRSCSGDDGKLTGYIPSGEIPRYELWWDCGLLRWGMDCIIPEALRRRLARGFESWFAIDS